MNLPDKKNNPIGIFDSGIGGLTVLKEIFKVLPNEDTIYLGDTARVPYGIRSPETVMRYSFENTNFLVSKNIKLLVIACNTASSIALNKIKGEVHIPVIGVIEPGAKASVKSTKNKKIGVIGTEATIKSSAYKKAITSIDSSIEVFGLPCPLFVSLVEEGWTQNEIAAMTAEKYLSAMKSKKIDTLVLGCTHYPLLENIIRNVMGNDVFLVDSAVETAKEIKNIIETNSIEKELKTAPRREFYVTDSPERFVTVGGRFLEQKIEHIEKINLGG